RSSPVTLPRDQPVAQAVLDRALADSLRLQPVTDPVERHARLRAVELTAVHHHTGPEVRLAQPALRSGWGRDDLANRKVVTARELEVALVVRRHGHDRAGAVRH